MNREQRKAITERINALLKSIQDDRLDDLLWVVQQYAAEGMNQKGKEE